MSNTPNIKPANLGRFSEFIKVPKTYMKLPKADKRSRNIISIIAGPTMSDETYIKHVSLRNRLEAVRAECTKRNLKFIAQNFAFEAINYALTDLENELGIEPPTQEISPSLPIITPNK
jgi:hypothetical protein